MTCNKEKNQTIPQSVRFWAKTYDSGQMSPALYFYECLSSLSDCW